MAVLATGQISIANLGDLRGVIQQVDPPAHPADGALWLNTETRALARWDAGEAQWAPVVDPIASAMIAQLQGETVLNDDFQTLMDNAAHLAQIAGSTELIDNLAQTMGFGPDGLIISSLSGEFAARLGTQQLDFLKEGLEENPVMGPMLLYFEDPQGKRCTYEEREVKKCTAKGTFVIADYDDGVKEIYLPWVRQVRAIMDRYSEDPRLKAVGGELLVAGEPYFLAWMLADLVNKWWLFVISIAIVGWKCFF